MASCPNKLIFSPGQSGLWIFQTRDRDLNIENLLLSESIYLEAQQSSYP